MVHANRSTNGIDGVHLGLGDAGEFCIGISSFHHIAVCTPLIKQVKLGQRSTDVLDIFIVFIIGILGVMRLDPVFSARGTEHHSLNGQRSFQGLGTSAGLPLVWGLSCCASSSHCLFLVSALLAQVRAPTGHSCSFSITIFAFPFCHFASFTIWVTCFRSLTHQTCT